VSKNIDKTRVRFAPAPTGLMHIGNIRTALLNYLYSLQTNGSFILRIEDTDPERNFDPEAKEILKDLQWLNINYDEGPQKGGPHEPYFQSKRTEIYKKYLNKLKEAEKIYRCFCTGEELEKKRNRQIALKQPPRYDKACLKLSTEQIQERLNRDVPFIWRFKVEPDQEIEIHDISKGSLIFNSNNLTDFPITRQNGSFTFLFANAIDDILMDITHIFRGEDHLSNSANQLLIYKALQAKAPKFLHMPIVCNLEGKKLSKRDMGFSLQDLQKEGFLPEAINNYLAILGKSLENEILTTEELVKELNFESSGSSQIKYDIEKLKWINHKWISKLNLNDLVTRALPILKAKYPEIETLHSEKINELIKLIQPELTTLNEISEKLAFFFVKPNIQKKELENIKKYRENSELVKDIIISNLNELENPENFITLIKAGCKEKNVPLSLIFPILRLSLTENVNGPNIIDIINLLGVKESRERLLKTLT
jgi:nondiscriminating glutamyl-tRNA synthetase